MSSAHLEADASYAEVRRFLLSIGRAKLMGGTGVIWHEEWLQSVVCLSRRAFKSRTKATMRRLGRTLVDDRELRATFDALVRMGDRERVIAWIIGREAPAPLTKEEAEAARIAGIKKKAVRAEALARAQLRAHTRALAREKKAVKRWDAKVRYYDRKKA